MPTHEPILRGDILAKTEITRDVMTFWVRGGVLRPIEAPTGVGFKLRFEWYEANIAPIMNQLRILGVSIKGMLSVCKVYRDAIAFFDGRGATRDEVHAMWMLDMIERNVVASRVKRAGYRDIVEAPPSTWRSTHGSPRKRPMISRWKRALGRDPAVDR